MIEWLPEAIKICDLVETIALLILWWVVMAQHDKIKELIAWKNFNTPS